jgi:hypothetical protein
MIYYDHDGRRQIAAERIERIADDYARANPHHSRRRKRSRLAAGLQPDAQTEPLAHRPPLEA